jgi:hypothetical protein
MKKLYQMFQIVSAALCHPAMIPVTVIALIALSSRLRAAEAAQESNKAVQENGHS